MKRTTAPTKMESPTRSRPTPIARRRYAALGILAVVSCLGCGESKIVELEAETPSVRLRAILDPWLQNLNDRDRDAWRADEVYAQQIAADASFDDAILAAEQERLHEAALDLEHSDELNEQLDSDELINRFDAYDFLWQTLEDAKALRIEARRAPTAAARELRQRLDTWRAETGKTRLHERALDKTTAALTGELAVGNATAEDLVLELELERLRLARLHAGPRRYYPGSKALTAMLAVIEALEQAISIRRSEPEVAEAKTAGARLRAILDPWLQNLNDRDRDAWRADEVYARQIAADASFDDAILAAEQERLHEAALDLEHSDELNEQLDSDELISRFDAYDFLWQTLEDAKALRIEARRAPTATARELRQRLDAWCAETGKTRLHERALDDATQALTDELVAGDATGEDLALELELERLRLGRLHGGPARGYPAPSNFAAMLAVIEALEQAISRRESQAVPTAPEPGG